MRDAPVRVEETKEADFAIRTSEKRARPDEEGEAERRQRERAEKFRRMKEAKQRRQMSVGPLPPPPRPAEKLRVLLPRERKSEPSHSSVAASFGASDEPERLQLPRISADSLRAAGQLEPTACGEEEEEDGEDLVGDSSNFKRTATALAHRETVELPEVPDSSAPEDPLDIFMVRVEKQRAHEVRSTMRKIKRHEAKGEQAEKERRQRRGKTTITREEIDSLGGDENRAEDQPVLAIEDEASFLQALKEHAAASEVTQLKEKAINGPLAITNADYDDENKGQLIGVDDDENQQGAIDDFLEGVEPEEGYFELLERVGSKKELQAVDHSAIEYSAFKKNLYVQVREISSMKDHEVVAFRRTNGNIRVRGKGCPRPIKEFTQCGLTESLLKLLTKRGCETPFPIQMQAIPALMAGRNVIGIAETGSGKTLAYLIPLLRHVLVQEPLAMGEGPIGLIISPTRELAQQITQEARRYCNAVKVRCALLYGGGRIGTQLSEIKRGAEIVVGTPGRLTEILTINKGRVMNLKRVTFVVLDEADRMFDLGFGPQVERIINNVRPDRQIAMFSATFPAHIEGLAKKAMYKPLEIVVGDKGRSAASVTQIAEVLPDAVAKFNRLLKILGEWYEHGESIIIFASRQTEVDELALQLMRFGYPALALHGGQDQEEREITLSDFKQKRRTILVATSIASRGLDVRSVVLVINYTAPDHLEDYVHRIGRTGRAGNIGVAYTFFTPDEADRAEDVLRALEEGGQPVPPELTALSESHARQVDAGTAVSRKVKGFGGRGYKFTQAEQSAQQEAKQYWKKELGIGETEEKDEEADAAAAAEATARAGGTTPGAPAGGTPAPGPPGSVMMNEVEERANALLDSWTRAILDPVQKEQQKKALLPTIRQLVAQQQFPASLTPAFATGSFGRPDISAMVQQALQPLQAAQAGNKQNPKSAAAAVAAKQTLASQQGPSDYIDPATGNYVCTLSINDYPSQARHRVSHRDTLSRVSDSTGAILQVRGVYLDPDKRRQNPLQYITAKELHVEIIAPTQVAAQKARRELRMVVESIAKKQLNLPNNR